MKKRVLLPGALTIVAVLFVAALWVAAGAQSDHVALSKVEQAGMFGGGFREACSGPPNACKGTDSDVCTSYSTDCAGHSYVKYAAPNNTCAATGNCFNYCSRKACMTTKQCKLGLYGMCVYDSAVIDDHGC
jgi:hypothetical protein